VLGYVSVCEMIGVYECVVYVSDRLIRKEGVGVRFQV